MRSGPFFAATSIDRALRNPCIPRRLAWKISQTRRVVTTLDERIPPTAQIAKHPIHPMLVSVPIVCFIGALLTDITYYVTAEIMWADFSSWLLVVGVILGVLAAIAGLVDFLGNRVIRSL